MSNETHKSREVLVNATTTSAAAAPASTNRSSSTTTLADYYKNSKKTISSSQVMTIFLKVLPNEASLSPYDEFQSKLDDKYIYIYILEPLVF